MSVDNKLKQVTDVIHGTIFLSTLESEMISTPYFYRLHDIYQSSTVYMTYPSNRTKRYEHSLGVMQLASRMLFSSITNADDLTTSMFFKDLETRFDEVYNIAIESGNDENRGTGYYGKIRNYVNSAFYNDFAVDSFWDSIEETRLTANEDSNIFSELALNQFQYYPMIPASSQSESTSIEIRRYFIYRCLLQAIRIVALFHDVGHPPFSHIIENTLKELYNTEDKEGWDDRKRTEFSRCMQRFVTEEPDKAFVCNSIYVNKTLNKAATHERIGFSLLQHAFSDAIERMMLQYKNANQSTVRATTIYFITIAEFAMAILTEKDCFFKSIHSLVDGIMDADRLDYIVRDTYNSGVDWGNIPYDRLITPMKMAWYGNHDDGAFVFAFPKKVEEDIIDVLYTRFKLFVRINFHHTCMKTAGALQTSVKLLALDYLTHSDDSECINPEISILWTALSSRSGDNTRRIMQWNDSFLISTLHKALLNIPDNGTQDILKTNLEEILLNTKKYYSVIKRGQDCKRFIDEVFTKARITRKALENFKGVEYYKLTKMNSPESKLTEAYYNQVDSVKRSEKLLVLEQTGDLELLKGCGFEDAYELLIRELNRMKEEGVIEDFRPIKSTGRRKIGLPKHSSIQDEIYLYNNHGAVAPLDEAIALKPQIKAMMHSTPWIYIYVKPPEIPGKTLSRTDISNVVDVVFERLSESIAREINEQEKQVFGSFDIHQEA